MAVCVLLDILIIIIIIRTPISKCCDELLFLSSKETSTDKILSRRLEG